MEAFCKISVGYNIVESVIVLKIGSNKAIKINGHSDFV